MLSTPLVLVLGAGSSRGFGRDDANPFPLGDDLRYAIAASLNISVEQFGTNVKRGSRSVFSAFRIAS